MCVLGGRVRLIVMTTLPSLQSLPPAVVSYLAPASKPAALREGNLAHWLVQSKAPGGTWAV